MLRLSLSLVDVDSEISTFRVGRLNPQGDASYSPVSYIRSRVDSTATVIRKINQTVREISLPPLCQNNFKLSVYHFYSVICMRYFYS